MAGIKSECNHMRRVLFLLSHTEKGGGEVVIYNLVKHLDRTCFEPFVGHVDFRRGDFIHEFTNLRVTPVDFRAGHLRNPLATAGVVWRIGRFIRRNRVDVVFTSGAHNHIYAALAKRIVRVPIVTYIMNYYQPRLRDNPSIMRLALRLGADYYVVDSNSCMEPLRQLIPKDAPSEVVYHGVDEAFISGPSNPAWVRAQLGISSSQRLISVIGRLQRWKGQDIFLRAAATVSRTCPEARFAVVGGALFGLEEDYREELQRLIDELGLRGRCWLVGHQANIQDWMAASDIVVHASRESEPGANVVMEAMAMGRPVIASTCGAPVEIIEDGVNGLLFKPEDDGQLASQILRILRDSSLAETLGRAAAGHIQRAFTAEKMAARVGEVLDRVLRSTPALAATPQQGPRAIVFTLSSSHRAGHEMSIRNIIKVVDRKKFKPIAVFLCRSDDGSFPDELRNLGAEVHVRLVGRLRNPLNVLRTARWLARLIEEKNVALMFTSGGHNHTYARIATLKTRRPAICHENFFFKKPFWRNGPIYSINFLLGSNAYFSNGKSASASIRAADPWHSPVVYHPPMLDLALFDYKRSGGGFRKQMSIPEDAFVYAIVGRLQRWKGQDIFVKAALHVMRDLPETYFVVAGGCLWEADRNFEAALKRMVVEQGAQQRILFTGFLDDPVPVFAAADVICHCSRSPEPTGNVIIEAFAMKKPVISVNEGGPLELVCPGIDGWLIPPDDVDSLVNAMRDCLHERDQLATVGERGYQKVISEHSESAFSTAINSVIELYASNGSVH